MTDEFLRALAAAIINQACRDFVGMSRINKHDYPHERIPRGLDLQEHLKRETREFFCSEWYQFCADCIGWGKSGYSMLWKLSNHHRVRERAKTLTYNRNGDKILWEERRKSAKALV